MKKRGEEWTRLRSGPIDVLTSRRFCLLMCLAFHQLQREVSASLRRPNKSAAEMVAGLTGNGFLPLGYEFGFDPNITHLREFKIGVPNTQHVLIVPSQMDHSLVVPGDHWGGPREVGDLDFVAGTKKLNPLARRRSQHLKYLVPFSRSLFRRIRWLFHNGPNNPKLSHADGRVAPQTR